MRAILSSLLFCYSVSCAKNVTMEGLPGVSGLISVKGQQRGEVIWHKIGQTWSVQDLHVKSLFEVLRVNVTSANAANIKVIFNGGTHIPWLDPPDTSNPLYQSLYRKYCASWFGGDSSVNCENVILPRFGIWAPFGTTQIAVTQDTTESFDYAITFRKDYDRLRAVRMAIGMFFFLFGSFFSHSQPVHYLVATAFGSVGFSLILLFLGMRLFPGNKPSFALIGAASASFMAWLYNTLREAMTAHFTQYFPYYVGLMAVGGFAGFAYAYKHPLDANSRFLCLLFIRVASVGLIVFEGPTSYLVSIVVVAAMCLLLLFRRCGCSLGCCCRSLCDKRPDEPLPEPEKDSLGTDALPDEVEVYRRVPSRPPSPQLRREEAPIEPSHTHITPSYVQKERLQTRNTLQRLNRTPTSSFSSDTPLRARPVSYSSGLPVAPTINDAGFDFKDTPLPPAVTLSPEFILPPLGQPFNFNRPASFDSEEVLEQIVEEFETFIKAARKRMRPPEDEERDFRRKVRTQH